MNKLLIIIFTLISATLSVNGDNGHKKLTTEEYIDKFRDDAINDMMHTGVPASITLAQGILESSSGNSMLAREANNHFGIKCHSDWRGERVYKDDDHRNECFRKYPTALASFKDHSRFLRERPRYAFLFDYRINDYKAWAKGLKKAGYATNPKYADHLIRIIEQHELYQYDKGGKRVPLNERPDYSYGDPSAEVEQAVIPSVSDSEIRYNHNEVPYIISKTGDTYYSIAARNDMMLWQVLKYNEAEKGDILPVDAVVYLKPKRGTPTVISHTVVAGESVRDIAQQYGVRSKKIYKKNNIEPGSEIEPGTVLKLR